MHVALVSPAWPPESNSNGIVTYVRWMREGLVQVGCRVSVLAFVVDESCSDSDVYCVGPLIEARGPIRRLLARLTGPRPSVYDGGAQIGAALARLHEASPLDIVEMEESFGWAATAAQSTRVPIVVKLHGPAFLHLMEEEGRTPFAREKMLREGSSLARTPFILSPSRGHLEDTLRHYGLGPALAEHLVNPLGLANDAEPWDARSCDSNTVLFVGRFDKVKGGDVMIRAFQSLRLTRPALRLKFVGPDAGLVQSDGSFVGIEQFIASLKDPGLASSISHPGRLRPSEIASLRRQAACVVVPSRRESQGYTALEAMLQGCPIVCADVSGLTELVDDGINGLKAKAGDADDLAAKIGKILDDPELAARLGVKAREYVLHYHDPKSVAIKACQFYKRAIFASSRNSQLATGRAT